MTGLDVADGHGGDSQCGEGEHARSAGVGLGRDVLEVSGKGQDTLLVGEIGELLGDRRVEQVLVRLGDDLAAGTSDRTVQRVGMLLMLRLEELDGIDDGRRGEEPGVEGLLIGEYRKGFDRLGGAQKCEIVGHTSGNCGGAHSRRVRSRSGDGNLSGLLLAAGSENGRGRYDRAAQDERAAGGDAEEGRLVSFCGSGGGVEQLIDGAGEHGERIGLFCGGLPKVAADLV
ncbi:unannotated protein [freshwater metagenome]|uniref:Unannotated protein n=1 Tax=freshwater metagenome TaxID=449393 RepID=A0A6J5YEC9_9ZZZZ